MYFIPTLSTLP